MKNHFFHIIFIISATFSLGASQDRILPMRKITNDIHENPRKLINELKLLEYGNIEKFNLKIQELEKHKDPTSQLYTAYFKLCSSYHSSDNSEYTDALHSFHNMAKAIGENYILKEIDLKLFYQYRKNVDFFNVNETRTIDLLRGTSAYIYHPEFDLERKLFFDLWFTPLAQFQEIEKTLADLNNILNAYRNNRENGQINVNLAHIFIETSDILMGQNKVQESIALTNEVYQFCDRNNLPVLKALAMSEVAFNVQKPGLQKEAISLYKSTGHKRLLLYLENRLALIYGELGQTDEAVHIFEQILPKAQLHLSPNKYGMLKVMYGFIKFRQDRKSNFQLANTILDEVIEDFKFSNYYIVYHAYLRKLWMLERLNITSKLDEIKSQIAFYEQKSNEFSRNKNNLAINSMLELKSQNLQLSRLQINSAINKEKEFKQKWIIGTIIASFLLTLFIVYYLIEKVRIKAQIEETSNLILHKNKELEVLVNQLENRNKTLLSFSTVVSRDIAPTIKIINESANFLNSRYDDDLKPQDHPIFNMITNSCEELNNLINTITYLSSFTKSLGPPALVNLQEILENVIVQLQKDHSIFNIKIHFLNNLPMVQGHQELFNQLFVCIIKVLMDYNVAYVLQVIKFSSSKEDYDQDHFNIKLQINAQFDEAQGHFINKEQLEPNYKKLGENIAKFYLTAQNLIKFYGGKMHISNENAKEIDWVIEFVIQKDLLPENHQEFSRIYV